MIEVLITDKALARFRLTEPVQVRDYVVPAGFVSDGESIPWFARWLFPRASKALLAAFAHDHRMQSAESEDERFMAHRHFRDDLEYYGLRNWRRQLMWRAVLLADHLLPLPRKVRGIFE